MQRKCLLRNDSCANYYLLEISFIMAVPLRNARALLHCHGTQPLRREGHCKPVDDLVVIFSGEQQAPDCYGTDEHSKPTGYVAQACSTMRWNQSAVGSAVEALWDQQHATTPTWWCT